MKTREKGLYLGNQNLPTEHYAVDHWTPKMLKDLRKCSTDIVYFAENFFTIVDPDKGKTKIKLFKYQKRILRSLRDNRYNIMLASRQCGKTTIMTIYALWLCCFQKDKRVMIVANKEDTAIGIFRRIKMAYELLPNWLKTGVKKWGETGCIFSNDSSIGVSTTSTDSGRSHSCNVLIIDEMAFVDAHIMNEFWNSVYPIISRSKKSKIIIASTPNGEGNLFHKLYSSAQAGGAWHPERVDWWEMPGRDEEWKAETIAAMGSREAFDQEFGNTFLQSGESMLDPDLLQKFDVDIMIPKFSYDDGAYKIFEEPREHGLYVAGVDVAEGVKKDSSVIQIMDLTNLDDIKQSAIYRSNTIEPYDFTKKLFDTMKEWGSPPCLIERNNCGGQVVDRMVREYMYEKIVDYAPTVKGKNFNGRRGVICHTNAKYKGVTNMRYWVNQLKAVTVYDEITQSEFKNFIRYPNGKWAARKGDDIHDDTVMSMIWALMMLEEEVTKNWFEILETDDNGKPSKLGPIDYGVADYMTPIHEIHDSLNPRDHAYAPVIFGVNGNVADADMAELQMEGWEFVGQFDGQPVMAPNQMTMGF
jgi:hypothetical protein